MPKKEIINGNLDAAGLPFSPCVRFGNTLYLSGMVGINHLTGEVGVDAAEQTLLALERIKHVLEQAGTTMDNVLSATCFLADAEDYPAFNQVYHGYFIPNSPARLTVIAKPMRQDMLVEIMCTACIPDGVNQKEIITGGLPAGPAPVSPAVKFGNTIYLSGMVGISHLTGEVGKHVGKQTHHALDQIKQLLEDTGSSMDQVLTSNCFVKTRDDFPVFNDVWQQYFTSNYPGRATLESGFVRDDLVVEIMGTACIPDDANHKEILQLKIPQASSSASPTVPLPISPATKFGDTIYVSGYIGINHHTGEVGQDVGEQTHNILARFKDLLEDNGTSMDNVLSVTCFLANKDNFEEFNESYREFFPSNYPARITIETPFINPRFVVEIMMTACMPAT